MAVTNGRIADSALVSISGKSGARLRPGAAAAWEALRAAVHAAHGWWPTPTGATDAYRPYTTQQSLFLARYTTTPTQYATGKTDRRVWNGKAYYRKKGMAAAAVPGTSNHGLGITVDITGLGGFSGAKFKQLSAIAVPLGWSNAEGRSVGEAWHWSYTGDADRVAAIVTAKSSNALSAKDLLEEEMPVRVRQSNGSIYFVDLTKGTFRALDSTANTLVDKLRIDIVWDGLTAAQRDQVRQLVVDLATPVIDA